MNIPAGRNTAPSALVVLWAVIQRHIWRLIKWIVHWWTSTSELERICAVNDYRRDATLVLALDEYFARSKTLSYIPGRLVGPASDAATAATTASAADAKSADVLDFASLSAGDQKVVADAVDAVFRAKRLAKPSDPLRRAVTYALGQMRALNVLAASLDAERSERYSAENAAHERALARLWALLRPDVRLSARLSTDWEELGFQGRDPATDFRGMGVLGLHQLIGVSEHHTRAATTIHRNTQHPNWFGYAITGLNLTHDLFTSLYPKRPTGPVPNAVRTPFAHFLLAGGVSRRTFLALYALYFIRLSNAWLTAAPPNVMSFKAIHDTCFAALLADAEARRLSKDALPEATAVPGSSATAAAAAATK